MLECNNFWRKIGQLQPLELLYHNPPPNGATYSRIQIGGDTQQKLPAPKRVEAMNEVRLDGTLPDLPPLQQNSDLKQYYKEALDWHLKSTVQELQLSATLCGRLYEDVGDRYIWKTKWGLPPSLIKATSMINPPPAELENLMFDMQLVEASLGGNTFIVVPEGIRGQTRRQSLNNFCEFKGLKLACSQQGQKRRLMILAWLVDPTNPKNRIAVDCFLSPEIQVFSENGRVIQIEKAQQFMHYFQLFDPDVFQKSNRRVEEDKQHFYVYMLKKNPKIKNILYIAFKFPEIVSIYINRSQLKGENGAHKTPTEQFCELLFTHQEPAEGSQLHLVANYLNPESRIVMKIDCPPEEFKFIINRDFTSIMSVLVGDVIPIDLDKFVKIDQEVKPTYIRFYRKMTDSQASDKEAQEAPVGSQSEASPIKNLDLEEQRSNDPKGDGSKEVIRSPKQHKNKHLRRKKNNVEEDEDSLFVSNGQQEQVSSASFSDRKIKRTSYAKWLEKSKRGTLKQKEQHKKLEKFIQNSKASKPPQGQTKPSTGVLQPKPSSQAVQFQPSQVSYVLMDTQQGRIFSPQQMQLVQPNMPLSMSSGNIITASQGGFGGMVPANTGSAKILIGNPQMMNGQAQLMQVIQRDKDQQQQKFNTSDGKQGMKWSQPQLQSQPQITGFVASQQQPQPTILMGNPQIGFNSLGQLGQMNQFGQISPFGQMNPIGFNQFGQFSQFPQNSSTQLITIPAQAFMSQQNMPTYQNIVVADQMPAAQNNSAFRPAFNDQSGGMTNQSTASHNNGVKIERDQSPSPNSQSNRGLAGVETRHQRNKQDKQQPSQPRQEMSRQQITQELRPAIIMPSGYGQQMPNFNMIQQLGLQGLQAVIPQQNGGMQGMQGMQLVSPQPGQTFYAMPHTGGPVQAQLISVRQPNSTGDRLY